MNLGSWMLLMLPILLIGFACVAFASKRIPVNIVPDWRGAWKLLSMHVAAIWGFVIASLVADPSLIINFWNGLPAELKPNLPRWAQAIIVGVTFLATFYAARLVKQPAFRPGDQK